MPPLQQHRLSSIHRYYGSQDKKMQMLKKTSTVNASSSPKTTLNLSVRVDNFLMARTLH